MRVICLLSLILISNLTLSAQECTPFLPELLNKYPNVRDISISPNGDEMYFSVQSYKKEFSAIVCIKKENGEWKNSTIAPFSGQFIDIEPAFAPNGLTLYFASNRPKTDTSTQTGDYDIWCVSRTNFDSQWSNARNLGAVINTNKDEFYPSVSANGNLYFTASYSDTKENEDIYISEFKDGKLQKPYSLPSSVNSDKWDFNAYVAPDELYIIFTSYGRADDFGGGDLYISFKDKNNNWVPAENMGKTINSTKLDYCPFVDAKSNVLYFTSEKSNIKNTYNGLKDFEELLKTFSSYPNGLSRVYYIPFEAANK